MLGEGGAQLEGAVEVLGRSFTGPVLGPPLGVQAGAARRGGPLRAKLKEILQLQLEFIKLL